MLSVKCDNCDHLVKVEDTTKEYKLPLLFIFLGLAVLVYADGGRLALNYTVPVAD